MNYIYLLVEETAEWSWCGQGGVQEAFNIIRGVLNVLRIAVPIGLIVMTTIDIIKKVINPEDKEGQQKIMHRAIAALIVFLIPTFIGLTFKIIDWGKDTTGTYGQTKGGLTECWEGRANSTGNN